MFVKNDVQQIAYFKKLFNQTDEEVIGSRHFDDRYKYYKETGIDLI